MARETVERYLFLLEQTYVLKLVRPFSRNLRSELTKTPKIFFLDTGLMQMMLWLKRLQREALGSVFKTSLIGELLKKHGDKNIRYWRTQDKKEIDIILEIIPIQAKLNFPRRLLCLLSGRRGFPGKETKEGERVFRCIFF